MSPSSNTTAASTATGPHRFRSSAASFSPSQPSNIQLQQQQQQQQTQQQLQHQQGQHQPGQGPPIHHLSHLHHQQQQQHHAAAAAAAAQQQMYQQYMYAGVPPPMSVNPYYPQYIPQNPYMPIPAAAYSQFINPYSQPYNNFGQQGYTNGGYSPTMHKGYNNANSNNTNNNNNNGYKGYHKGARRERGDTINNGTTNSNGSDSNVHSSATTKKDQITPETPETTPASTTPPASSNGTSVSTSASSSSETTPLPETRKETSIIKNGEVENKLESQEIQEDVDNGEEKVNDTKHEPEDKLDTISISSIQTNQEIDAWESILHSLPVENISNGHLSFPIYFNTTATDFASDFKASYEDRKERQRIMGEQLKEESELVVIKTTNQENVVEYKKEEKKQQQQQLSGGNWADMLQKKAAAAAVAAKKTEKSVASSPAASATNAPASKQSVSEVPTSEPSSFPLGITLLKLMFDSSYSPFAHDSPIFKIKPRGLTNTGNICYMNAVLQVLLYCEPFNRLFKVIELKTIGSLSTKSGTPLMDTTINFFKEFATKQQQPGPKALSPEKFYFQLIKLPKFSHLKWGQQEDAEEFLGYFLDGLHEEFALALKSLLPEQIEDLCKTESTPNFKLNVKSTMKIINKTAGEEKNDNEDSDSDSSSWNEVAGGGKKAVAAKRTVEIEPTPISSLFVGQFRSVLTIPKSKESQLITLDPFQCIQLDISDSRINTIEDAFKIFNELEDIPYKTSTSSQVIAKKQTFIDAFPNVLVIHLKRFLYAAGKANENEFNDNVNHNIDEINNDSNDNEDDKDNSTNSNSNELGSVGKLRKKVKYTHTFTIPNECISPAVKKQQPNISKSYRLIGVVYHHGNSTDAGHYTCDVLRRSSVFDEEDELIGKKFDNEWIRIDDTQVQQVDKLDVLNGEEGSKTAYILMYQKI